MILTKNNIPRRWLSMYRSFTANGSNYDVVQDSIMKDAYTQLDIIFGKTSIPKMITKSKSKKIEEFVDSMEKEV